MIFKTPLLVLSTPSGVSVIPPADLWDFWADTIPAQTDNTVLTTWPDRSSGGHSLTSPGTNGGTKPFYRTAASANAINGHPVVQVVAGNQMDIKFPNFVPKVEDKSFTCYWLGRYTSPQAGNGVLIFNYATAGGDAVSLAMDAFGTNVGYEYNVGGGAVDVNLALAVSGVQVLTWTFDKTAGLATLHRNGVLVGSDPNVGGTGPGNGFDWGQDFIEFFAVAGGVSPIQGDHARIIGYQSAHPASTRNIIVNILKRLGGIP